MLLGLGAMRAGGAGYRGGVHTLPPPHPPTGAIASTEVKLKLQEFLLSKAKEPGAGAPNHSLPQHPTCWYAPPPGTPTYRQHRRGGGWGGDGLGACSGAAGRSGAVGHAAVPALLPPTPPHPPPDPPRAHHTSLEQSSPPQSGSPGTPPSYKVPLLGPYDSRDDFPLRKTGGCRTGMERGGVPLYMLGGGEVHSPPPPTSPQPRSPT